MTNAAVKTAGAELALTITRVFEAPREAVFRAWTDPAQVAKWKGPANGSAKVLAMDARIGGSYRIAMQRDDGSSGPVVSGVYRDVKPPERLVFTWAWEDQAAGGGKPGHETLVTVTFKSIEKGTEMTLRHANFDSAAARDAHNSGWLAPVDRLAKLLTAAPVR